MAIITKTKLKELVLPAHTTGLAFKQQISSPSRSGAVGARQLLDGKFARDERLVLLGG